VKRWLVKWWSFLVALIIGGGIGWGLGHLLIWVIDKRISM